MPAITAIGAAHIDRIVRLDAPAVPGASNPGRTTSRAGGVIRNAAETAARLGVGVRLVTRVGADAEAARVRDSLSGLPVTFAPLAVRSDVPTASYTAVLDPRGDLVIGLADMAAYETITPAEVLAALDRSRGIF